MDVIINSGFSFSVTFEIKSGRWCTGCCTGCCTGPSSQNPEGEEQPRLIRPPRERQPMAGSIIASRWSNTSSALSIRRFRRSRTIQWFRLTTLKKSVGTAFWSSVCESHHVQYYLSVSCVVQIKCTAGVQEIPGYCASMESGDTVALIIRCKASLTLLIPMIHNSSRPKFI